MIVIYIEVEIISITISYSGGKEAMMEYYLKQATEASEEKDVILYFDEAELGLISEISTGTDCFYLHNLEFPCTKSGIHRFHYKKNNCFIFLRYSCKDNLGGSYRFFSKS